MNHLTEKHSHRRAWRLRLVISIALLFLAVEVVLAQAVSVSARVWEGPIVLPTYELGPPTPYPALLDWQRSRWRPVYPYPLLYACTTMPPQTSHTPVYLA